MRFTIDGRAMQRSINRVKGSVVAVEKTLNPGGRAEVITSRRKKLREERGQKVLHGMGIANILRDAGNDPFELDHQQYGHVADFIADEINEAIEDAQRSGRPQVTKVQRALIAAAQETSMIVREKIAAGRLGSNASKYARRKARLVAAGKLPAGPRGGSPYGWSTGRFYHGIKHRFRRGFAPRGGR